MAFLDELALLIFIACICIYFFLLVYVSKREIPSKRVLLKKIYKNWTDVRIEEHNENATVQALRNFIMGNSIFISAMFILLGILIGLYNSSFFDNTLIWGLYLSFIQIVTILIVIIFSLINFILSIREITKTTLLLTGNPKQGSAIKFDFAEITRKSFVLAQSHWTYGIRGLFYLISALLWLVDALLFTIATITITIYLILHDIKKVSNNKSI